MPPMKLEEELLEHEVADVLSPTGRLVFGSLPQQRRGSAQRRRHCADSAMRNNIYNDSVNDSVVLAKLKGESSRTEG